MINTNNTTSTLGSKTDNPYVNPKGILGKDDFMKLMLVELQYQDPTEPMDSEKILSQTSQLATLESASNTNKALEELSKSLANTQQFSIIAAIGKTAYTGSDAIRHEKGKSSSFEIYFPTDVKNGEVEITDNDGNLVKTIRLDKNAKGVLAFEWDGTDNGGKTVEDGIYHIKATYTDPQGDPQQTALGSYPIESVRFENNQALLKLGSSYIPFDQIQEIY